MKLLVVGHSMVHIRQLNFFRRVAKEPDMEVMCVSPDEWGEQRMMNLDAENFYIRALSAIGPASPNPYVFRLIGLQETIDAFDPDWIYVQQEPGSTLANDVSNMGRRWALFTWENLRLPGGASRSLETPSLVVCGNDGAERLVLSANESLSTTILPQVGVDVEHFAARDIHRDIEVGYFGRPIEAKGITQLLTAWPRASIMRWVDYARLPWEMSRARVVVAFSQPTEYWEEQAMPYVAVEALCCGAAVVVSDSGSIPFWTLQFAGSNRGITMVEHDSLVDLREAIDWLVTDEDARVAQAENGRAWVAENLSSDVIARRLVCQLNQNS